MNISKFGDAKIAAFTLLGFAFLCTIFPWHSYPLAIALVAAAVFVLVLPPHIQKTTAASTREELVFDARKIEQQEDGLALLNSLSRLLASRGLNIQAVLASSDDSDILVVDYLRSVAKIAATLALSTRLILENANLLYDLSWDAIAHACQDHHGDLEALMNKAAMFALHRVGALGDAAAYRTPSPLIVQDVA